MPSLVNADSWLGAQASDGLEILALTTSLYPILRTDDQNEGRMLVTNFAAEVSP